MSAMWLEAQVTTTRHRFKLVLELRVIGFINCTQHVACADGGLKKMTGARLEGRDATTRHPCRNTQNRVHKDTILEAAVRSSSSRTHLLDKSNTSLSPSRVEHHLQWSRDGWPLLALQVRNVRIMIFSTCYL